MMARREINREYFVEIWRMKDFISRLPHNTCVCSQHNEPVSIRESEFLPNPGTTAPLLRLHLLAVAMMRSIRLLTPIGRGIFRDKDGLGLQTLDDARLLFR